MTIEQQLASANEQIDDLHAEINRSWATIAAIAEIVTPQWLAGRVLPRMIGAEEMAQVAAIRAVLAHPDSVAQEDTGASQVSENAERTPSGY